MSKRKNLFKDITTDDHETICSIFNQVIYIESQNSGSWICASLSSFLNERIMCLLLNQLHDSRNP